MSEQQTKRGKFKKVDLQGKTIKEWCEEQFNKWIEETVVKINTFIDLYNKNELKETANWLMKSDDPILKLMVILLAFSENPDIPLEYVTIEDIKEKYSWILEENPESTIKKNIWKCK